MKITPDRSDRNGLRSKMRVDVIFEQYRQYEPPRPTDRAVAEFLRPCVSAVSDTGHDPPRRPARSSPPGIQLGDRGEKPRRSRSRSRKGQCARTGGELDVGIDGQWLPGKSSLPDGESAFTRDGKLNRSADGQIVTMDGYRAWPTGSPFPTDAKPHLDFSRDGQVSAYF